MCGDFVILQVVLGEYVSDYGCLPPNPVSIHRECLRLRLQAEWCMRALEKMKILGAGYYGITDVE